MTQQAQRSGLKRFFASRLFLVCALLLALLLAFGYGRAYYQDYKIRQEVANLQNDVQHLERRRLESMEILRYVTSPAFVEEKARTELNMQKPNERVLIIQEQEEQEESGTDAFPGSGRMLSNPLKWWYYFTEHALPPGAL